MFFVMLAIFIYYNRQKSRVMKVMFLEVVVLALGFIKDLVFLVTPLKNSQFVADLVTLFDVHTMPLVCAFFIELVRPGYATTRKLLSILALYLLSLVLYVVLQSPVVLGVCYTTAFVIAVYTLVAVRRYTISYTKCLEENYSSMEHISVKWVYSCAVAYFVWFFVYCICFYESTWVGEICFDLSSIAIWNLLWVISRHHRVVPEMDVDADAELAGLRQTELPNADTLEEGPDDLHLFLAPRLRRQMEEVRLYLDPTLSLGVLAKAVGSNKSYVSEYINRNGSTFYDYVNEYRIRHACQLFDQAPEKGRMTIQDVAAQSGFNSLSSFNRYFYKLVGTTPTAYLKECYGKP